MKWLALAAAAGAIGAGAYYLFRAPTPEESGAYFREWAEQNPAAANAVTTAVLMGTGIYTVNLTPRT